MKFQATLVFLLDHLSLVVSSSERNKMSAQALATVMGPPLMIHSANVNAGNEVDHAQPIAVLKYLLQIWPHPQKVATVASAAVPGTGAVAPNPAPQVNIPPGNVILWCLSQKLIKRKEFVELNLSKILIYHKYFYLSFVALIYKMHGKHTNMYLSNN